MFAARAQAGARMHRAGAGARRRRAQRPLHRRQLRLPGRRARHRRRHHRRARALGGGIKPDFTLLLDVGVELAWRARVRAAASRTASNPSASEFFERVRAPTWRARRPSRSAFRIVDAALPAAEVVAQARALLGAWLDARA
jgi:thymidylate kinase